jgi:hypothetical protein
MSSYSSFISPFGLSRANASGARIRRGWDSTCGLPTVAEVADERYLIEVFDDLARTGGQAAGADGLRFRDFARADRAQILSQVSRLISGGKYVPGPVRNVSIPKRSGGTRTLRLPNVIDRTWLWS